MHALKKRLRAQIQRDVETLSHWIMRSHWGKTTIVLVPRPKPQDEASSSYQSLMCRNNNKCTIGWISEWAAWDLKFWINQLCAFMAGLPILIFDLINPDTKNTPVFSLNSIAFVICSSIWYSQCTGVKHNSFKMHIYHLLCLMCCLSHLRTKRQFVDYNCEFTTLGQIANVSQAIYQSFPSWSLSTVNKAVFCMLSVFCLCNPHPSRNSTSSNNEGRSLRLWHVLLRFCRLCMFVIAPKKAPF